MKAPKKIYIMPHTLANGFCRRWFEEPFKVECIEYVRKDAFIEKACEWLKENFLFDEAGYCKTNIYSTKNMIYDFKNTLGSKL